MVSGFDSSEVGKKTLVVTYEGLNTVYIINVEEDKPSIILPIERVYNITILDSEGGEVVSNRERSFAGRVFRLEAVVDEGYELVALIVRDSDGNMISGEDGIYVMPESDVTVIGVFSKTETDPEPEIPFPFGDVEADDWFYGDVKYVFENGLMNGVSADLFMPGLTTTRGMIVTVLYRLSGQPEVNGELIFDDVAAGSYYEKAIIWASENGIVNGYGEGKFGPDDAVTREQMAAILCRYAKLMGYDTEASADLTAFADADSISSYAVDALSWANANGLINGIGGGLLDPAGKATRAQVAAILHRFVVNIAK